ncbi:hypothetical protein SAMN05216388_100590 [Halorientalis persicus]|uniref:Solute:sodium symporter small subunit n=1 Tax=Halorientalis persicus TaxID=1367881 RepID=A0A1H8JI30_9EURY|nr:hypothetical protein [Halorientalis persicus]SEN80453.1 hypothetical protein SAMN05216388_100590 [Halorientalis persicus]
MTDSSPVPPAQSVSTYVEEGARIAAILLVWGIISLSFAFGLTEIGVFGRVFWVLGGVFALTGVLNAVVYVLFRTVDYWHWQA